MCQPPLALDAAPHPLSLSAHGSISHNYKSFFLKKNPLFARSATIVNGQGHGGAPPLASRGYQVKLFDYVANLVG